MRVVLIPPAGGSASFRQLWSEGLEGRARVEMNRARPREGEDLRASAGLRRSMPTDGRWLLVGHSLGALVAFEIASAIEESGGHPPDQLIVMASRPPKRGCGSMFGPMIELSDDAFLDELRRIGAIDTGFHEHPMRKLFLPGLRSDLRLLVSYEPGEALGQISIPLSAWHGRRDRLAPPRIADGWESHTRGGFSSTVFDGGHFFPTEQLGSVLHELPLQGVDGVRKSALRGWRSKEFDLSPGNSEVDPE